jgi:sialate O-acetylesterase
MFAPRVQFTAVAWWQGESDCQSPVRYACRFPTMVAAWRRRFRQDLPWVYVELAALRETPHCNFAWIRAAQTRVLEMPNTARVVAIDSGDPLDIHPKSKLELGRRVFVAMLSTAYGDTSLPASGPVPRTVTRSSATNLTVHFAAETIGSAHPLAARPARGCDACCQESPFWTMDQRGVWARVHYQIQADSVVVISATRPIALRYAWEGFVQCTLVTDFGGIAGVLPAAPFERAIDD